MALLPEEQRVLIGLVCIDRYSYKEAADITGTPIGTIMSRLARARRELHAHLGGNARERWCAFRHPNRGAAHERQS